MLNRSEKKKKNCSTKSNPSMSTTKKYYPQKKSGTVCQRAVKRNSIFANVKIRAARVYTPSETAIKVNEGGSLINYI